MGFVLGTGVERCLFPIWGGGSGWCRDVCGGRGGACPPPHHCRLPVVGGDLGGAYHGTQPGAARHAHARRALVARWVARVCDRAGVAGRASVQRYGYFLPLPTKAAVTPRPMKTPPVKIGR